MLNNSDTFLNIIQSPLSCDLLKGVGVYYALLLSTSIFLNSTLLWTFFKHKNLRKPANLTNISLVSANLVLSLFDLPIMTVNAFNCGYSFSNTVCLIQGAAFFGMCSFSNAMLALFSFERYWMVCKPTDKRFTDKKPILILIAFAAAYSAVGTTWPFTGWSSIELEPSKLGCNVDMYMMEPKKIVYYVLGLFMFLFAVPFTFIVYFNYRAIKKTKELSKKVSTLLEKSKLQKSKSLTLFKITLIACILTTNIPFAIYCTYVSYIEPGIQLSLVSALINVLGKTLYVWAAMINIVLNTDVKKYFKKKTQNKIHMEPKLEIFVEKKN